MSPSSEADHSLEHLVFEIAKGVSGETGEAFFRSLVRHLARALDADYVLVGALQPDGERIATLALHGPGGEQSALEYKLAGTPCAHVVQTGGLLLSERRAQLFPHDQMLAAIGAEGYVGSPLVDSNGRCLGLICAITDSRCDNPQAGRSTAQNLRGARRLPNWSARTMKRRSRTAKSAFAPSSSTPPKA